MKIEKRYLILPICRHAAKKSLQFMENGKLVYDMWAQIAPNEPDAYYYPDLRDYVGRDIDIKIEPKMNYTFEFTDTVPTEGLYKEKYRPAAHFTAARGWINDPNGLLYYEGQYHMFFQHNACGPLWDNMQWGHAVSKDMLHWTELEIAMFPDELGAMFSGSAIVDTDNRTGLKENEHDVILLYYTACPTNIAIAAHSKTSQCLAYSTDGGVTFRKYQNNPIIPHIIEDNRDPAVIFCEELDCYLMALYLSENDFALFTSSDLLHWEQIQTITIPGEAECPDIYPLYTESGERYWVMTGASDYYLIGKMQNGKFDIMTAPRRLHHSMMSYAAQTYSGITDGRRIRFAWNRAEAPESIFNGSMCTPTEMYLTEDEDGLSLCQRPIAEYCKLWTERITVANNDRSFELYGKAQDITITFETKTAAEITMLGLTFKVDADADTLTVKNYTVALNSKDGIAKVRFITDTTAIECYTTGYKAFGCIEHVADYGLNTMTVSKDMIVYDWKIATLSDIREESL